MRVDVAVVGGGIAGVSVAAELAAAGLSVVVLEQEPQLAQHATGRSAAAFLESYGSPEIRALTRASRAYLAAAQGDAPPLLNPRRLLWIAGAGHDAKLAQLVAAEPLVRAVSEDEARRHCPALRPGWLVAAAAEDGAQDLDVAGLFDRFRRAAIRGGVVIRTSAAVDRAEPEGSGWLVRTADGADLHATTLVNAAGAWADVVARPPVSPQSTSSRCAVPSRLPPAAQWTGSGRWCARWPTPSTSGPKATRCSSRSRTRPRRTRSMRNVH